MTEEPKKNILDTVQKYATPDVLRGVVGVMVALLSLVTAFTSIGVAKSLQAHRKELEKYIEEKK